MIVDSNSQPVEIDNSTIEFMCSRGERKACNHIITVDFDFLALMRFVDFLKSPSSCLFDFVARSDASRHEQRPLRGLTYSTLKFMRSTCGKSMRFDMTFDVTLREDSSFG